MPGFESLKGKRRRAGRIVPSVTKGLLKKSSRCLASQDARRISSLWPQPLRIAAIGQNHLSAFGEVKNGFSPAFTGAGYSAGWLGTPRGDGVVADLPRPGERPCPFCRPRPRKGQRSIQFTSPRVLAAPIGPYPTGGAVSISAFACSPAGRYPLRWRVSSKGRMNEYTPKPAAETRTSGRDSQRVDGVRRHPCWLICRSAGTFTRRNVSAVQMTGSTLRM